MVGGRQGSRPPVHPARESGGGRTSRPLAVRVDQSTATTAIPYRAGPLCGGWAARVGGVSSPAAGLGK